MRDSHVRLATGAALAIVVLIGTVLRFQGMEWDAGHHLHPDERFLAIVGDKIRFPDNLGDYFNTRRSPLNPYNQGFDGFAYGTLPLFVTRAIASAVGMATYDQIHLVGRALSALADTATILFTFLTARIILGPRPALVAAALYALAVVPIQLSHFFAVDTFLTAACAAAIYLAHRAWRSPTALNYALLGAACGAALATKLSAALLAPVMAIPVFLPRGDEHSAQRTVGDRLSLALIAGAAALMVYRIGEPYSFNATNFFGLWPNEQRFSDLNRWVKISSGEIEVPFMIQWANTPNPRFALESIARWGMGGVSGVLALVGLLVAAAQCARWRSGYVFAIVLAWAALNLAYFGFQFAKFVRYFQPAYPALAILAAATLVFAAQRLGRFRRRWACPTLAALAVITAGAALLHAVMFTGIYRAPHTRVQASEWIYDNVPLGSSIAVEHWDDALPLGLPGRERRFNEISMELYAEESPEKVRRLIDNLGRADYIVLSSNRLYGSIPRLPLRYPVAIAYYEALFRGSLGFDLVAEFRSRPRLLGLELNDDAAQEDLTVYDHPTVLIYQKSGTFSAAAVAERLSAIPIDRIEHTKPVEAGARSGLMLSPASMESLRSGSSWSQWFALDGISATLAVPIWLLATEALGLIVLPACWWLFGTFPDRGFAVSKLLGLLGTAYTAWLAASVGIGTNGPALVAAAALSVGAVSLVYGWLRRRWLVPELRAAARTILAVEVAFLAAFCLMLTIRALNPDLWHATFGGEKPMDFAYLNAVVRTPSFPPYDPWFSGGYINYYYFGFVLIATLIHLSAVPPAQAYNLAVATVFGLTAAGVFSLAVALTTGRRPVTRGNRPLVAGVISAGCLCLAGNLDAVAQTYEAVTRLASGGMSSVIPGVTGALRTLSGLATLARNPTPIPFDFWRSTRFIGPEEVGPIHEFPYFTFLYGDLHAHMIALPLQLAAIGIALELSRLARPDPAGLREMFAARRPSFARLRPYARPAALLAVGAVVIGALRATNTWDFPLYVAVLGLGAAVWMRPGGGFTWLHGAAAFAAASGIGLVGSSVAFAPYLRAYELFYTGAVPSPATTSLGQFLLINGALLFLALTWLTVRIQADPPPNQAAPAALMLAAAAAAVGWLGNPVTATVLLTSGGTAWLAFSRARSGPTLFYLGLLAAALGALALPEWVAVRGDVGRMNTVFKFYLQAWVILSVLAGPMVVSTSSWLQRWRFAPGVHRAWLTAASILAVLALLYPLRATPVKVGLRFTPTDPTLDGMAFMARAQYSEQGRDVNMPGDYQAIRWMLEHVEGAPVILEAQGPLYHWGSRFSVYTGLPTVMGWDWHQKQQRSGYQSQVDQRVRDVRNAYETPDPRVAAAILQRYGVGFIVVGGLERAYYPPAGLEKFERLVGNGLDVVYRQDGVTIYRVGDLRS